MKQVTVELNKKGEFTLNGIVFSTCGKLAGETVRIKRCAKQVLLAYGKEGTSAILPIGFAKASDTVRAKVSIKNLSLSMTGNI